MDQKITLVGYEFEGPYNFIVHIKSAPGVYAVLCAKKGNLNVLAVGKSQHVRDTIKKNPSLRCWRSNCEGFLNFAIRYCGPEEQAKISAELRSEHSPPCGS